MILELHTLADLRRALAAQLDVEADLRDKAQTTPEYRAYVEARDKRITLARRIAEQEDLIRDIAIREYLLTATKHPAPGVTIKMVVRLSYNPNDVREWALRNAPAFLQLDKTTFERAAKARALVAAPVDVFPEPAAYIAQDLDAVLKLAPAGLNTDLPEE